MARIEDRDHPLAGLPLGAVDGGGIRMSDVAQRRIVELEDEVPAVVGLEGEPRAADVLDRRPSRR